jgi:hypothetical protein
MIKWSSICKGCDMAKWFDDVIAEKISEANNHVILVPARNANAPLDAVDVFDGVTGQFIIADVPEIPAREFAIIWNSLTDSGDNTDSMKKLNLAWLYSAISPQKGQYTRG